MNTTTNHTVLYCIHEWMKPTRYPCCTMLMRNVLQCISSVLPWKTTPPHSGKFLASCDKYGVSVHSPVSAILSIVIDLKETLSSISQGSFELKPTLLCYNVGPSRIRVDALL